jgi:hypothetical protein
MGRTLRSAISIGFLMLAGCGDDGTSEMDGSVMSCTSSDECDDGIYCNGPERCDDDGSCQGGSPPCGAGSMCVEDSMSCVGCEEPDRDGDGVLSRECGGTDCDDDNRNRFPGNTEICDAANLDEDCDPTTFGVRDADGDSFPDASCCNEDADGSLNCGNDCDDTISSVHPTEAESCDSLDNDCDGSVDEGVVMTFWTDMDMDGRGSDASSAEERRGCEAPTGFAPMRGDCDDSNPAVGTGLPELCDGLGVDEDCDGNVDEGSRIDCYSDADDDSYPAEDAPLMMVCRDATRTMVGGCPVNFTNRMPTGADIDCDDGMLSVNPDAAESCNGRDDDCDGTADNGFLCAAGSERGCSTSAACGSLSGTQTCNPSCTAWSPCALPDEGPSVAGTCNGCDDDLDGTTDDNFACVRGTTMSGCTTTCGTSGTRTCNNSCNYDACEATEECNYCDDDRDGNLRSDELALAVATQSFDYETSDGSGTVIQGFGVLGSGYLGSSTAGNVSVVELTQDLILGYGTVTYDVDVVANSPSSSPEYGWSVFMYKPNTGSSTTPSSAAFGAPTNRDGFAAEWDWNGSGPDDVTLVALRASATDVDIESDGTTGDLSSGTRSQQIRLIVTPDNPDTGANETRVEVFSGVSGAVSRRALCDSDNGSEPNCRIRVEPGERWRFGVGFANGPSGSTVVFSFNEADAEVTVLNACSF